MEQADLIVRLIVELREDMNARFERVEAKLDEKADKKFVQEFVQGLIEKLDTKFEHSFARMDARMAVGQSSLMTEIGKVNDRLTEEVLWGRREIRSRLERCERDIEELKNRKGS